MCDATAKEKRKAMYVMLKGTALGLFTWKATTCETYEEALELLRTWYNSSDKYGRLQGEWQAMTLSQAMQEKPEESEISVSEALSPRS